MHQLITVIILITTSIALAQATKPHDLRTGTTPPPIQQQNQDITPQELHTIKQSQNFKHLECMQDLAIQDKSTCPPPSSKF